MTKPVKSRKTVATERKKILPSLSLKWAELMFESFIDSIDVGVYVLDCNGVVTRVNAYMVEQYQWDTDELVGKNIFELLPDLAQLGVEERFKQVISERRVMELVNLQRKDRQGRDIFFNLKGIPILDGSGVKGVLAVMNDITEKRVLQFQVAETEQYLQNLIDNANDIIYTLDSEGNVTFLNKMGQKIMGYTFYRSERDHYSKYVLQKDQPRHEKYFRKTLKGSVARYESVIRGNDDKLLNVLINLTPIRKGEEIVGVLGIARDITERKQMEAQLLQASKMAAIGELASGVAHEINNPVGIISGTAEQVQFLVEHCRDNPQAMAARLSKHIDIIREQAERCKKITQGLLNFARKTEIHSVDVNLAKLIEETLALVENRALSEGKRITAILPEHPPSLHADPHQLEQVFLNLVNNALDATDLDGTVTIEIKTENGLVRIDFVDDGIGVPEENIKKIFDPFFTTKPIGKGTGLGLSICFGIIQNLNGRIEVESKPGEGTRFTVRIPLKQPKSKK